MRLTFFPPFRFIVELTNLSFTTTSAVAVAVRYLAIKISAYTLWYIVYMGCHGRPPLTIRREQGASTPDSPSIAQVSHFLRL